jgi:hypothetical protein
MLWNLVFHLSVRTQIEVMWEKSAADLMEGRYQEDGENYIRRIVICTLQLIGLKVKVKLKLSLCFTKHHAMKISLAYISTT